MPGRQACRPVRTRAAARSSSPDTTVERSHVRPSPLKKILRYLTFRYRMSSAAAARPEPLKIERHVWVISGVVILGMIMSILDTTIVNVALDTLSKDLHSPISQVQWVVTGYLLALAAVMPVTGWMARRFGAKRVYLVSLRAVHARLGRLRALEHARRARHLPRAAGHRRRHDHAARAADHGPGRGAAADGAGDGRRLDARDARADPRPGRRRR